MAPTPSVRLSAATRALAWLGGTAFVLSFAYFVFFYFHAIDGAFPALGRRNPAAAALVDVALFTAFAMHHSALARSSLKTWIAEVVPYGMERSLYVWLSSALFFLICWYWQTVPGTVYDRTGLAAWPHLVLQAGGIALTARGAAALDVLDLAGIRQVYGIGPSDGSRPGEPGELATSGPFSIVRHPVYLGWMLFVFGTPRMTVTRLIFALVSTTYLVVAIPLEEASLMRALGAAYQRYAARVRWRLIPGVW